MRYNIRLRYSEGRDQAVSKYERIEAFIGDIRVLCYFKSEIV